MICNICPRKCNVDREKAQGFCGVSDKLKISRAALHFYEEPCISGKSGSGTVFFSGCNLKCVYCQNKIIAKGFGKEIDEKRLVEIFFELKEQGANNINLVTPDHYANKIITALKEAKRQGLDLPIVYNTSGYCDENVIKSLSGLVDIYLTDFKYFNSETSKKYSGAPDYTVVAKKALKAMIKTVGKPKFFENGMLKSGVIVRHLCLPSFAGETKDILDYLSGYKDDIIISIMNQFTPIDLKDFPEINRTLSEKEYQDIIDYANLIGIKNAYIQEGDTAKESFIPSFCELKGV